MTLLRRTFAAALVLLAFLSANALWAAGRNSGSGRFDARVHNRAGGVIALAPRSIDTLEQNDELRQGWAEFRSRHGAAWTVYLDERTGMPALVSGSGIDLFPGETAAEPTLDDLESRIRSFLTNNHRVLGNWDGVLELDTAASGELREGLWQVVFRLAVDGVRVENARFDFQVAKGKLILFGATHWAMPEGNGVPAVGPADARAILETYLGEPLGEFEAAGEPELVLMALSANLVEGPAKRWTGLRGHGLTHALVWRLQFQDPDGPALWVGEIDAHDGEVISFYDGAHYASVHGGVYPEAPDLGCSSGGCEIQGLPMPYADWTESGQATAGSDAYGNLVCSDPAATFVTSLDGPYANIDDNCGGFLETGSCSGPLDLGLKAGENCDVAIGSSPGNTAAARSSYYHLTRVAEVARHYNPSSAWLGNTSVTIHSNWPGTCNASSGQTEIYMYRSGTSWAECANSGEIQGIIVHEWGHTYDRNDGGGFDITSEAYGDVVSMLASRESCFGPGLFTDGTTCSGYGDTCLTCTGFRDHDWTARAANTPATPQDFVLNNCNPAGNSQSPCGGSVHCESYPIGESIFDLATRDLPAAGMDQASAWQLVERLWYSTRQGSGGAIYTCALPNSDSCSASSWYQRMRVADDNDANLANGTPHAAELYAAFARHNIACGDAGDPENQSTTDCPELPAPVLTVTDTESGPSLSWLPVPEAAEYQIYRGDLGCNRQQVPVVTLDSSVTSWLDDLPDPDIPRYYRVEAAFVNTVCRSPVSDCETSGGGPRLQMNGHRLMEDGIHVNGNGLPDPGETLTIPVTLSNQGTTAALGVTARMRTANPDQGRVIAPLVAYPDLASGTAIESAAPHFQLTLFESGALCGDKLELELDMDAAGAGTRTARFLMAMGDKFREFHKVDGQVILRQTQTPVISTLDVADDQSIADLDITLNITHPNRSELIVELTSPEGTTVRLHNNSGTGSGLYDRYDLETEPDGPGVMADFNGESTAGTWTLSVEDTTYGSFGMAYLNSWTLHVEAAGGFDCTAYTCAEPAPAEGPASLTVGKSGADLTFDWTAVAGAAGYHILGSPVPDLGSTVDLFGKTTGATSHTMTGGVAATPPLTFFQVRAVNSCSQESP